MAEDQSKNCQCEECEDCPQCEEGAPGWMATFSDLCTLLLTFFILLLSFSTMDIMKFKQMMGSVEKAFGYQTERPGSYSAKSDTPVTIQLSDQENKMLDNVEIGDKIKQSAEEANISEDTEVEINKDGVMMRLKGNVGFGAGSASIDDKLKSFLQKVAEILKEHPDYNLKVLGHTDNIPIKSGKYDSNWELSSSRAVQVIKILVDQYQIDPKRLTAIGYGETRPLTSNDSPDNRAKNRRVEFIFYKEVTN